MHSQREFLSKAECMGGEPGSFMWTMECRGERAGRMAIFAIHEPIKGRHTLVNIQGWVMAD